MFLEFLHGKLVAKAESCGQTMSPCLCHVEELGQEGQGGGGYVV